MTGKIYLVGAGPGDSGLLTLRGHEVLRRADVVIYDRLVGEGVLAMIPEAAERIDAGKSPGNHTLTQREIESAMTDRAMSGKIVVRLKGGDPYIFGRGGEEAEAIIRAGLAFEVVPGVTSAVAVPAYAGIPATHRDYCSGVSIHTAHRGNENPPSATKIFLMGAGNSEALQAELLREMSPDTPCAVIQNGTTSSQRVIRSTVSQLHASVVSNNITPPAVIIAGKVAGLNLTWRENLPLSGKRVIITRPAGRGEKLSAMLRDMGAEVIMMPTIRTRTLHGSLDGVGLSGWDWAGFTSVTGVEALFELLAETGRDVREFSPSTRIAAIGPATKDALISHGLRVDYMPGVYDGAHLAEGLAGLGGKILMFRAENGTPEIGAVFTKYGIFAVNVCVYRADYVQLTHVPSFADIIIFTSSSTVRGFAANTGTLRESLAVCIGRQTADEALRAGFTRIRIAEQATVEAIAGACT